MRWPPAQPDRRYRGRDGTWWIVRTAFEQTVDSLPSREAKRVPGPLLSGVAGGYDIDLRHYPERGVILLGHLQGYDDGRLLLAPDLQKTLAEGDETLVAFRNMVDDHITKTGIDVPDDKSEPASGSPPPIPSASMRELHLGQAGICSVVWATGFRHDFRWILFPIFDEEGEPGHRRGVTSIPGLYFLGLEWLYKRKSRPTLPNTSQRECRERSRKTPGVCGISFPHEAGHHPSMGPTPTAP